MKTKTALLWTILLVAALSLSACDMLLPTAGPDPNTAPTQVVQTVQAILTQSAFATLVAAQQTPIVPTPEREMPTATPWVITATPQPPTATPLPLPTNTPLPIFPTATFAPTAAPLPCNLLSFVKDVTVPDNTSFAPGETFVKTWRIKNAGSCAWAPGYALVFSDGNSMGGPSSVNLTATVNPGDTVDLSVTLTAPRDTGSFTGNWKMRTANGMVFGGGAEANKPFWVKITVQQITSDDPKKVYVLIYNYCSAEWRSNAGALTCPSTESSSGAVYRVNEPVLEGGYKDDEPALVMIPGSGDGGMVQGKFPQYTVQTGDSFKAVVGCMDKSSNCNAMIQLNYSLEGGAVQNLGTWTQTSDGNYDRVNIDLAPFVGKKIQFYLVVYNNGNSNDDRVFWLLPHVYNPNK